jgi:hypothetical protein
MANGKGWKHRDTKNRWYGEECKITVEELKKAREKLIKGRRENEERECHHNRKWAYKIIGNKKKLSIKNVEEDQKHYNTSKMYQTLNQLKKGINTNLTWLGTNKEN